MNRLLIWILFLMLLIFSADPVRAKQHSIPVFVSILPYAYFVERVGGEFVEVSVLVGPGHSPETFDPSPKHVIALQNARIYFRAGMPFEEVWMKRIQSVNPSMSWVDLREGIDLLESGESEVHLHEEDDHHHHGATDVHVWLDPVRVSQQTHTIARALGAADPKHQDDFIKNARLLRGDLQELHRNIQAILEPVEKRVMALFHPSWGYFADRYDFKQVAIETGGKEPSAKQAAKVIQFIQEHQIKTLFVQEQMDTRLTKNIARQTGSQVVSIDPLAKDYINNLLHVAKTLAKVLP